jgi:hypothetical protein
VSEDNLNAALLADTQHAARPASAIIFGFSGFLRAWDSSVPVMLAVRAFAVLEDNNAGIRFLFALVIQLALAAGPSLDIHKNIIYPARAFNMLSLICGPSHSR